jgi:hypothetical protein
VILAARINTSWKIRKNLSQKRTLQTLIKQAGISILLPRPRGRIASSLGKIPGDQIKFKVTSCQTSVFARTQLSHLTSAPLQQVQTYFSRTGAKWKGRHNFLCWNSAHLLIELVEAARRAGFHWMQSVRNSWFSLHRQAVLSLTDECENESPPFVRFAGNSGFPAEILVELLWNYNLHKCAENQITDRCKRAVKMNNRLISELWL